MTSDPDQAAVLSDQASRLLVEAPPGTGKTVTAIRLAGRDIDARRVGPTQRVLVLTFSRNARSQLEGYAAGLLSPEQRARTEITNYHSWFWSKVGQFRQAMKLPLEVDLVTGEQRREDVLACMAAEGVAHNRRDRQQLGDYSRALEFELKEGQPERLASARPKNAEIATLLRQRHQLSGRLHYDDLAYYTWCLLNGSETLRELWRHKYPVIIVDEYQDTSPLQAAIVAQLAGPDQRLYAFADPLQQIYTWRDASKKRMEEFRSAQPPSEHRLRTLHRYRHRPALQAWMQQVRAVLLDDAASVTVALPPEVTVLRYDPSQPERGKVWGAEARELWQLDGPIADAFRDPNIDTIAVLARRREQLAVLERRLTQKFRCGRLSASEDGLDLALAWVDGYANAISVEHHAGRLLTLAQSAVPRHPHLDLRDRLGPDGFDQKRLRSPRRELVAGLNQLAADSGDLPSAFASAQAVLRLACEGQDPRSIDWDLLFAIRRTLLAPVGLSDAEAAERARARVRQARFSSAPTPRRGLYLLSCHEGKGKEFDFVVLPHLSNANFKDDEESRQLLYVSLTRARHRLLFRLATGDEPPICRRLGIS